MLAPARECSLQAAAQRLRASVATIHIGNPSYALADLAQADDTSVAMAQGSLRSLLAWLAVNRSSE